MKKSGLKSNKELWGANIIKIVLPLLVIALIGFSCQKDDGPNTAEVTNNYILNLPPVTFPSEQAEELDSSATDQDLEYDYTIDYYTVAAGYNEQIVLNPQTDVIYPGALIKGESILDGSYIPIPVERKPITISTSLQGSGQVSVVVDNPDKLSEVREAVNALMNQEYDVPPANIGFTVEKVYSREQLRLALKASYDNGFGNINSSFDYSNKKIRSRFVAKFIQNYYTLDMDLPQEPSDLTDDTSNNNLYGSLMPMYISTVTFGRMALFTIESELEETEVQAYLEGSYGDVEGETSSDFESLKAKSTMKVYVLGGSGSDAGATINGFQDFKKYIVQGGNFSKESPGAPISYKLRYINDNSIARIVFAASYPIRTAIPRTDNIRYDISVRLRSMKPKFSDGAAGEYNELWGSIKSKLGRNSSYKTHWSQSDGGSYLKLKQNQTHHFSDNTTTNRTYTNLVGSDHITLRLDVNESDLTKDIDMGVGTYNIELPTIVNSPNGEYTYTISNYGKSQHYMDLTFVFKLKKLYRVE
ncbi:thiol-activated cytolysin family protein [Saccharicrinis sp. 156]|uniref:thiol-activated cytolysin family protein n=1 Tax=Saccharicrinis sp. 156 TaxID=3417574 RepID=UPI003D346E67